jgi:hypothetical protein
MWLMMPYLTEVWDMSIMRAAAVVNCFDGVVAILPLGLKIILHFIGINSFITDYWMLCWCGFSSTLVIPSSQIIGLKLQIFCYMLHIT